MEMQEEVENGCSKEGYTTETSEEEARIRESALRGFYSLLTSLTEL